MSAREIVLKPVTKIKVAKSIEKALAPSKEKEEALKRARENVSKKGFILK